MLGTKKMTPSEERKYLTAVLAQMDKPTKAMPGIWWICCGIWLVVFILFLLLFEAGNPFPPIVLALIAFFFGAVVGAVMLSVRAVDNWPTIRRHLSKESIRARIDEIEA